MAPRHGRDQPPYVRVACVGAGLPRHVSNRNRTAPTCPHFPSSHLHNHTHTLSFPPLSSPAGVPVVYQLSRRGGLDYEAFIGAFTVATSFLYHAADSLDTPVWGMARGKWHRLDNVFSIASFGSWIIYLMDLPARRRHQLN